MSYKSYQGCSCVKPGAPVVAWHGPPKGLIPPCTYVLFTRKSGYCFQRVLTIAILSVCLSVRPSVLLSVTRVDQSKTVQARITKSSPSAVWKTLVSGTVKLFHKFKGSQPERGR